MLKNIILFNVLIFNICQPCENLNSRYFPPEFIFGIGSSAYQTEGAWNTDGKTESIWDHYVHKYPDRIKDGSNADFACDSYHMVEQDVSILEDLGVNFYRFSLSWTRILPSGFTNKVNPFGIKYYNNLIDKLLARNITPMVTLYHWDLPQSLSNLGGFTNPLIIEWFTNYANISFTYFGDRVKFWTTFNEPRVICSFGYGIGVYAPGYKLSGIADYICGHNLLKAHASAYHLYSKNFKPDQEGKISLAVDCDGYEPATDRFEDIKAAERRFQFQCGWFSNPVFSQSGDYPKVMKDAVALRSKEEGFSKSRLPAFTAEEINYIKGTFDYIGLNHYSTFITSNKEYPIAQPSFEKDSGTNLSLNQNWTATAFFAFKMVPWGLRKVLNQYKDHYGDSDIYITENGYAGLSDIDDEKRVEYHMSYLSNVLDAIYEDDIMVKGYCAWSLMDYYEWAEGYGISFGLYKINYSDPERNRVSKNSAKVYRDIITRRNLMPICK